MDLDARTSGDGNNVAVDLCIVGAGPVGLALAQALTDSGLRIAIIESGGSVRDPEVQELNVGDSVGDPFDSLETSRARGIGGTSAIWSTPIRGAIGAKYLPLDASDFEPRPWAPLCGWPFRRDVLDPYYHRAHAVCGLGPFDYDPATWSDDQHPLLLTKGTGLTNGVYHCGQAHPFCETIPRALQRSSQVTFLRGATVTELVRRRRGGPVAAVRWVSLTGARGTVEASRFVLAAGGIENARILLWHARQAGNHPANDWVGRGFMEHPIDSSLDLISSAAALRGPESFYVPHPVERTPGVMGRIALAPELLRELQLPNASLRLVEEEEPPILNAAGPRSAARRLMPFGAVRRSIGNSIRSAAALRNRVRGTRYRLLIDLEELPHRDNRIVLSNRLDRLGKARAELHWRWHPENETRRLRLRDAIIREVKHAGLGRVVVNAGRPIDPDVHHHSGTTRMHPDPGQGVVDERLRVHGEENLYVVGSSVFPTAGFANPTLTAIALALRLADHLRGT